MELVRPHVDSLRAAHERGTPLPEAFATEVGNKETGSGIWRFYSNSWPCGGIRRWNNESDWRKEWSHLLPNGAIAFGEDVFGNQLLVFSITRSVCLFDHECGDCADLFLNPLDLLIAVLENGIEWIDFYNDGSLDVARRLAPISREVHLHWVTPRILGGMACDANVIPVERDAHLSGHAKLWSQISDLPLGTLVIPKADQGT